VSIGAHLPASGSGNVVIAVFYGGFSLDLAPVANGGPLLQGRSGAFACRVFSSKSGRDASAILNPFKVASLLIYRFQNNTGLANIEAMRSMA
jgi:hypothetical protein